MLHPSYLEYFRAFFSLMTAKTRIRYYKQNSRFEFDSYQELTNQIDHVINFSFSDWSILVSNSTLECLWDRVQYPFISNHLIDLRAL